jgi:uncharacterized Rmd1/YagE family protein
MSAEQANNSNGYDLVARAVRLGTHIALRGVPPMDRLAAGPMAVRVKDDGVAVLLRYGVVVMFEADPQNQQRFLETVRPLVRNPVTQEETEDLKIRIDPEAREGMVGDTLSVQDRSVERLQVIADVLGKSVALAVYESQSQSAFDQIEPFARGLARTGRGGNKIGQLQRHLGDVLLIQHEMIGRVEVNDKPDMLWDRPDLDRLHAVLQDEFEIHERKRALERKLTLVSQTAETVVGLIENARTLRVEWYIVILIVIEILLWLYELLI